MRYRIAIGGRMGIRGRATTSSRAIFGWAIIRIGEISTGRGGIIARYGGRFNIGAIIGGKAIFRGLAIIRGSTIYRVGAIIRGGTIHRQNSRAILQD